MDESISKIAAEAVKPLSPVIDALLGPTLKRLTIWSEKNDLKSRKGSITVYELMDQYLRKLLLRISEIKTIVFPQLLIPLPSIYEPLTITPKFFKKETEKKQFNCKEIKQGCNYLIVDSAGMGKSTFAKYLVLELITSTEKTPIFLELRRISDEDSLVGKIAKEIDDTQKFVDSSLLRLLLKEGNFVIILDGYDEISSSLREKIGEEIKQLALNFPENSVILTSRPDVNLPEIPCAKIYKIEPLSKDQAKSLILRYDAFAKIEVGENLIKQFQNIEEEFLETPLLIVLLYRTFGFNQSIATKISTFYDELYNALYKGHDLTKAGFAREKSSLLDSEAFRSLLRGFSFLLVLNQIDSLKNESEVLKYINLAIQLTSIKPTSPSSFFDDLILNVPLIIKDGTDFRFVHKSIQEFFAAEYLSYCLNPEVLITKIKDGSLNSSFTNSFQYLSEINPLLFRKMIVLPLAKKIKKDYERVNNPFIQTLLLYWDDVVIGLTNRINPHYEMEDQIRKKYEDLSDLPCNTFAFHQEVNKKNYSIFVKCYKISPSYPEAAFNYITEKIEYLQSFFPLYYTIDFYKLRSIFQLGQFVSIKDETFQRLVKFELIQSLCVELPNMRSTSMLFGRRIFNIDVCSNAISEIHKESEPQIWLEKMISGEK